jgi:hypothetical protein
MSSNSTVAERATNTGTEFGSAEFIKNAVAYAEHKAIVTAASKYDNIEDARAALDSVWAALVEQSQIGGGFTPATELGFGSDNAATVAEALIGIRSSVTGTRKAMVAVGKANTPST